MLEIQIKLHNAGYIAVAPENNLQNASFFPRSMLPPDMQSQKNLYIIAEKEFSTLLSYELSQNKVN